jgi:hypothetical protein
MKKGMINIPRPSTRKRYETKVKMTYPITVPKNIFCQKLNSDFEISRIKIPGIVKKRKENITKGNIQIGFIP